MNLILEAQSFAHAAHDSIKQVRKYTGEPYWVHTDAVAAVVAAHSDNEFAIAAAHLHDTLEDVPSVTVAVLLNKFPKEVVNMVVELTDQFTKENYPKLNREQRKAQEAARIARISPDSKTIKLADLFDNTKSITQHDPDFAVCYLREKERVITGLAEGDYRLLAIVRKHLQEEIDKLGDSF
jgi:(p)ppGpp synthase/HD superfamily hydrolase